MKCPNCIDTDMGIFPFGKHGAKRAKCPECGLSFVPPKKMKERTNAPPEEKGPEPAPVEPPPAPKKNQPAGRSIADDIVAGIRNWIRN